MIAGVVALVIFGGVAIVGTVFVMSRGDSDPAAAASEAPRDRAADLAKRGLAGCTAPEAVTNPTGGALERVECGTASGSDAVVSTFEDESAARADAERVQALTKGFDVGAGTGILVGPYWTINCSVRSDCEAAMAMLGGVFLS